MSKPSIATRTIKEIKAVAYRSEEINLGGEDAAYWVVRNPGHNITIIPPYRLGGGEFPKTYGHLHEPPRAETYQIVYGEGALLIQRMEGDRVAEIRFKPLNAGEIFTVPEEFIGHVLINLGSDYLIAIDNDDPSLTKHFYEPVEKNHGFGYFILEEEGGWKAVPNPNFKNLPPLSKDG